MRKPTPKKQGLVNRDFRHWPVHIVYREHGSLPWAAVSAIAQNMKTALEPLKYRYPDYHTPNHPDKGDYRAAVSQVRERYQEAFDEALHRFKQSPMRFRDPAIQQAIINSWQFLARKYNLEVFLICVMSNHVHVLLMNRKEDGCAAFKPIMTEHRRWVSRQIKPLLDISSDHVWARGAFDRDVRPGTFWRVVNYILQNPVKAGIVTDPLAYSGTWVNPTILAQLREMEWV